MDSSELPAVPSVPHGAHILLGEDHPINQRLTTHILARDNHTVDIAQTGCQVIEAFLRQPYDLILMDVLMPDMDGLAATAWIRHHESIHGGRVPIVGMTAGDLLDDQDRCLDAGMDAYLSKPFRAGSLLALVTQWTHLAPLDTVVLANLQALDRVGTAPAIDTYIIFLGQFLDSLPGQIDALRRAYQQQDHDTLHRIAHNLKGTGGTFGAPRITYLCAHLASLATDEGWPAVPAWLAELERTSRRLRGHLDIPA